MRPSLRTLLVGLIVLLPRAADAQSQDVVIYYHTDGIGSVRATTDANGGLLSRYDFEPFGVACGSSCGGTGTVPEAIQFAGKERDADTGFDYFGARYYESVSGRFVSVDPALDITAAISDPQRWNRYAYALNNPLRQVDPDGRDTLDLAAGFLQGVGNTVVGAVTGIVTVPYALVTDFRGTVSSGRAAAADHLGLLWQGVKNPSAVWDAYAGLATSANGADQRTLGSVIGSATATVDLAIAGKAAGTRGAAPAAGGLDVAEEIGILRDAARGRGNFGLGSATAQDAGRLGEAWVGKGYTVASDGKTLVSADGLRQYRPPSYKPKLKRTQANFEQRPVPWGGWGSNGHLDIDTP